MNTKKLIKTISVMITVLSLLFTGCGRNNYNYKSISDTSVVVTGTDGATGKTGAERSDTDAEASVTYESTVTAPETAKALTVAAKNSVATTQEQGVTARKPMTSAQSPENASDAAVSSVSEGVETTADSSVPDAEGTTGDDAPASTAAPAGTTAAVPVTQVPVTSPQTPVSYSQPVIIELDRLNAETGWELLLINKNYRLPEGYEPTRQTLVEGNECTLDIRVAPYYIEMYSAALTDGVKLTPYSGYRSYATQKRSYTNKINYYIGQGYAQAEAEELAAKVIMPPGSSEHNMGYAMDIYSCETSFESTAAFRWLQRYAADYGFIMRYPADKTEITNVIYEPWHWRYVGVDNAKAMKASGQCLEEYLGLA